MYQEKAVVKNAEGLHARPASVFVSKAKEFESAITIETSEKKVNAKSIVFVLSLGAGQGTEINIQAEGPDEEKAVKALVDLLNQEMNV